MLTKIYINANMTGAISWDPWSTMEHHIYISIDRTMDPSWDLADWGQDRPSVIRSFCSWSTQPCHNTACASRARTQLLQRLRRAKSSGVLLRQGWAEANEVSEETHLGKSWLREFRELRDSWPNWVRSHFISPNSQDLVAGHKMTNHIKPLCRWSLRASTYSPTFLDQPSSFNPSFCLKIIQNSTGNTVVPAAPVPWPQRHRPLAPAAAARSLCSAAPPPRAPPSAAPSTAWRRGRGGPRRRPGAAPAGPTWWCLEWELLKVELEGMWNI